MEYFREKAAAACQTIKDKFSPCTAQLNSENTNCDWKNLFLKGACIVMATLTVSAATAGTLAECLQQLLQPPH